MTQTAEEFLTEFQDRNPAFRWTRGESPVLDAVNAAFIGRQMTSDDLAEIIHLLGEHAVVKRDLQQAQETRDAAQAEATAQTLKRRECQYENDRLVRTIVQLEHEKAAAVQAMELSDEAAVRLKVRKDELATENERLRKAALAISDLWPAKTAADLEPGTGEAGLVVDGRVLHAAIRELREALE